MEIDIFKRKHSHDAVSEPTKIASKRDIKKIFYFVSVFLATRPAILGGMMPFGIALFAAEYISTLPRAAGVMVLISAGLVSRDTLTMVKYTAAAVLFTALVMRFPSLLKNPARRGALMTVCILSASLMVLAGGRILIYDWLMLAVEGTLVFGLTLLFARAKNVLLTGRVTPHAVSEDLISVSVFAATLILGMGTGFNVWGINITQMLCVTAALLFSYTGGAGAGAVSGIAIGLTAGIADGSIAPVLGAFAISSLVSGCFSAYGKAACFLSFVTVNSLITLYTGGSAEAIINLYGIFTAGVIFMLIPQKLISAFSMGITRNTRVSADRTADFLSGELSLLSSSLSGVAKTFGSISTAGLLGSNASVPAFFDRTVKNACSGCPRIELCWKKEFNRTYTSLFVMLQVCEKNGYLTPSSLPAGLSEKCLSVNKLVNTFNNMYDIYKVDKLWESRITEARTTMARQIASISSAIEHKAHSVRDSISFDHNAETAITTSLCASGVPLCSVSVSHTQRGILADIGCKENCAHHTDIICKTVSDKLGKQMNIVYTRENHLRLISGGVLDIKTGSAQTSKETRSGDSFGSVYTPDGKCILVLSDGMGSGNTAHQNSTAVVTLLCHMFSAGYDTETALSLVNSVLVLKSTDTSFATVDILLIDPATLTAEFIKTGASSGYFKYKDKVMVVSATNLPAGISPSAESEKIRRQLYDKNCIVMITDGIADADPSGDKWIVEEVGNYEGDDPNELAQLLVSSARQKYGENIRDDMTAAVAMVNKISQTG